jgi:hypothetical protein
MLSFIKILFIICNYLVSFVGIAKEKQHNLSLSLLSGSSQFDFKKQQELQYVKLQFVYQHQRPLFGSISWVVGASFAVNKFFNKVDNPLEFNFGNQYPGLLLGGCNDFGNHKISLNALINFERDNRVIYKFSTDEEFTVNGVNYLNPAIFLSYDYVFSEFLGVRVSGSIEKSFSREFSFPSSDKIDQKRFMFSRISWGLGIGTVIFI